MRKKTVNHIAKSIVWHCLFIMPLLLVLISLIHFDLATVFAWVDSNLPQLSSNIIFSSLEALFGSEGILPFAVGSFRYVLYFATYYIFIVLMRLAVEFLTFIPKLACKWLGSFTGGADDVE